MYLNLYVDDIGGDFNFNGSYWSSTEYSNIGAWAQYFPNGYPFNVDKYGSVNVRAVRAF